MAQTCGVSPCRQIVTLTYTPNYLYYGNDRFSYVANDGPLDSNVATVNLAVAYVNQLSIPVWLTTRSGKR